MNGFPKVILLVCSLFFTGLLFGQKIPKITFDAKVSQVEKQGAKLNVATVKLFKGDQAVDSVVTQHGKCAFQLDTGSIYKVQFSKSGYVSKFLLIDTHQLPDNFRFGKKIKVDVGLFTFKKDLDVTFLLEKPIGIAAYDYVEDKISWNVEYTESIMETLIQATLDYTSEKEKRIKL